MQKMTFCNKTKQLLWERVNTKAIRKGNIIITLIITQIINFFLMLNKFFQFQQRSDKNDDDNDRRSYNHGNRQYHHQRE